MKQKAILLLFLWLFFTTGAVWAQPWYFNEIYNPNNTWAASLSIIADAEGYFGTAISSDSITGFYNTCTYKISLGGEILFWKNYGRTGFDYYPGDEGSLVKFGNNYGLFGSVINWSTSRISGLFYKFDLSGDTILTRLFTSQTYNTLVGRTCNITEDNGFILFGEVSVGYNYSDVIMIKTDSNGYEQWRRQHGTSIDDNAKSIIQTMDGGYALGIWSRIPGQEETADPLVFKTDSLGNFEWSLNLGGPYGDDKVMLCPANDSCIMALTAYADSMYTPEYAYAKINLIKIDLLGNIIWNKKYGPSKAKNLISNISQLDNGDFLTCGYARFSTYLNPSGWLFRINSNGDSVWYRDYWYYDENPSYGLNFLYDISPATDQGFISVGQAHTALPPDNTQKMWVLKVDSVGCEIPNCWVGLDDWEIGGLEDLGRLDLEVWPNPCSSVVSVSITGSQVGQLDSWQLDKFAIEVYDIFGRKLGDKVFSSTRMGGGREGGWMMDVSALPPGLYLLVVKDGASVRANAKFVVAR